MIIVGFALIAMFFLGTYFGLLLERRNNQKENTPIGNVKGFNNIETDIAPDITFRP